VQEGGITGRSNADVQRCRFESLRELGSIAAVTWLGAGWKAINNLRRKHRGPGWPSLTWERACCVVESSCWQFSLFDNSNFEQVEMSLLGMNELPIFFFVYILYAQRIWACIQYDSIIGL